MDSRGLMMLLAGTALMLSPAAYWLMQQQDAAQAEVVAEAAPQEETEIAAEAPCDAPAVVSTSDRVDCNGDTIKATTRRVTAGGAVFVQVGD